MSQEGNEESGLASLFPFRLVGFGFLLAWDWLKHLTGVLALVPSSGASAFFITDATSASFTFAKAATLVLLAVMFRRLCPISCHRTLTRGAYAALLVSTAIYIGLANGAVPVGIGNVIMQIIGGCFGGFGYSVLILLWAEIYSRLGTGRVFLYGALSLVVATLCYLFITSMTAPICVVAICILTLSIYPTCAASVAFVGNERPADMTSARYPFPYMPVIIMAIIAFVTRAIAQVAGSYESDPRVPATLILGVAILIMLLVMRSKTKPAMLTYLSLALSALGCLSLLFGELGRFISPILLTAGFLALTAFVLCMLADASYKSEVPSLYLFGFAFAARTIMWRAGLVVSLQLSSRTTGVDDQAVMASLAILGLIVLVFSGIVWYRARIHRGWALEGIDIKKGRHMPSRREMLASACERAAEECHLTDREKEVLLMVLDGYSYQEICQGLFVSMSTVKTHIHHAYAKLGVHTREEAERLLAVSVNDDADVGVE